MSAGTTELPAGAALAVEHLDLRFGGVRAIEDFSLEVEPGALIGIIGPNGAGKSSLFNCLSGAYAPTGGSIRLDGVDITRSRPHKRAAMGVARTFQNLAAYPELSVLENLLLGAQVQMSGSLIAAGLGTPSVRRQERELTARAMVIAESLGLTAYFDQSVTKMPYGMQKRLDIARILLRRPRLVLLDEPLVGMNATEKQTLLEQVRQLHDELGPTILIVEHDVEVIMGIAQRVLVMNFGKQLAFGSPQEVQEDPQVIEAYLGGSRQGRAEV